VEKLGFLYMPWRALFLNRAGGLSFFSRVKLSPLSDGRENEWKLLQNSFEIQKNE
jgi:hypothetical protein